MIGLRFFRQMNLNFRSLAQIDEYVWHTSEEKTISACIAPTVKHSSGSVTVLGWFSSSGTGDPTLSVDGTLKIEGY